MNHDLVLKCTRLRASSVLSQVSEARSFDFAQDRLWATPFLVVGQHPKTRGTRPFTDRPIGRLIPALASRDGHARLL
jgi:hypothetical protein